MCGARAHVAARHLFRCRYNISLSVLEIRNIDDTKNTFDAEIYLTLDDCNDSRSKDRPPYIEWKNCIGTPKSQESEKSLSEIWKDEVAKLDTVSALSRGCCHTSGPVPVDDELGLVPGQKLTTCWRLTLARNARGRLSRS